MQPQFVIQGTDTPVFEDPEAKEMYLSLTKESIDELFEEKKQEFNIIISDESSQKRTEKMVNWNKEKEDLKEKREKAQAFINNMNDYRNFVKKAFQKASKFQNKNREVLKDIDVWNIIPHIDILL